MNNIYYGMSDNPPSVGIKALQLHVGPGWSRIIERLVRDLFELGWNGECAQVKEKFGGLRFYINSGNNAILDRIEMAERESYMTCEKCGEPGVPRRSSWIKTLCNTHSKDEIIPMRFYMYSKDDKIPKIPFAVIEIRGYKEGELYGE